MKKFFHKVWSCICAAFEWFTINVPLFYRVALGLILVFGIASTIVFPTVEASAEEKVKESIKDTNVYLNEEICYAGGIYVKVNSISVTTNEEQQDSLDSDKDKLSQYTLNLGLEVERRGGSWWTDTVKLKSNYFFIKSVNLKAKSKMAVFVESLAKATLEAAINTVVGGSINVIEDTISFVGEYVQESITNAIENKSDFKPIKCEKNQFKAFKPKEKHEPYQINISFPLKQNYLESENIIVLCIDQLTHYEQRVFLITRPTQD